MSTISETIAVSFTMPALTLVRNVNGEPVYVDWAKVPQDIIGRILIAATNVQLNNSYNSGGKDRTDAERLAQMSKKIDAWYRGEVNVSARGDSDLTAMRDQFIDEAVATKGKSRSQVEREMASLVEKVTGKASNSFDAFLSAVATMKAKEAKRTDVETVKQEVMAPLWERTQKAIAERAKAAEDISLADLF